MKKDNPNQTELLFPEVKTIESIAVGIIEDEVSNIELIDNADAWVFEEDWGEYYNTITGETLPVAEFERIYS